MVKDGHTASVLGIGEDSKKVILEDNGVQLIRLPKPISPVARYIENFIRINKELKRIQKTTAIDIVETSELDCAYLPKNTLYKKVIEEKTPLLGICLGAQMLGNKSEEGTEKGLAWIDMDVVKFDTKKLSNNLKVPHMNWNEINIKKTTPLFNKLNNQSRFYFVHTYHMQTNNPTDVLCTSNYGYEFVSGVHKNNIWGMQFHPEKSHKFGMKLLENFAAI